MTESTGRARGDCAKSTNFYEAGNAMGSRAYTGLNGRLTGQLSEVDGGLNAAALEWAW